MRLKTAGDYLALVAGSAITALGLVFFLVPNKIAAGGVSGLATIAHHLFGLPVGATMLVLNVPLFFWGFRRLGASFSLKSLTGMVALSVFTDALALWTQPLTRDPLLASLYGGVLTGIGLGLAFRAGGTTGGTDLAAMVLRRYLRVSVGRALLVADGAVIALAGIVFSPELALYALASLFVSSQVIDFVQEGFGFVKVAFIISDQHEAIAQAIITRLDRGVTILKAWGAYTGQERNVLLCVVARAELSRVKDLVVELDQRAFVIVADVREALGEGFTSPPG